MNAESEPPIQTAEHSGSLVTLALLSLAVGAVTGLVGIGFRLALLQADKWRGALVTWAQAQEARGLVLVITACAVAAAVAAWLVRRVSPHASGSGIPHVEAALKEEVPPAPASLIPVKFVGGVLAIGSGLALGREGPCVQMGATLAEILGKLFRCTWSDCRVLLAAGAGAGLATAFDAPIAGAVFVLEELVRRFDTRTTIGTFGASASAIAVSRLVSQHFPNSSADFQVAAFAYPSMSALPVFLALGLLAGLMGVAYNRTLLGALWMAQRLSRCPVELRAGAIGAIVGLLAWLKPDWIGGGDPITQSTLSGEYPFWTLALLLAIRFGLGAISYAALTPGGLFAPMLVLGAQFGMIVGLITASICPGLVPPTAIAVVGMAAFFTAVVRAPVTGMILILELTGSFHLLLPMLAACFAAMLVPTLLGDAPIYEALRERPAGNTPADLSAKER